MTRPDLLNDESDFKLGHRCINLSLVLSNQGCVFASQFIVLRHFFPHTYFITQIDLNVPDVLYNHTIGVCIINSIMLLLTKQVLGVDIYLITALSPNQTG